MPSQSIWRTRWHAWLDDRRLLRPIILMPLIGFLLGSTWGYLVLDFLVGCVFEWFDLIFTIRPPKKPPGI